MKLDLRKDLNALHKYLRERVRDYPIYVNAGPGADEDPVSQITIGFQVDQAGWVAVVFDTRAEAAVDGRWQRYIEENAVAMDCWRETYEKLYENGAEVNVTWPDGRKGQLAADDHLVELVGACLREGLLAVREEGLFNRLPVTDDCELTIEEHEGQFGWSARLDGGDEDAGGEEADELVINTEVRRNVAGLPKRKPIEFWIDRLDELAKRNEPEYHLISDVMEEVAALGTDALVPLLRFALQWAGRPEFSGDRNPRRKNPDAGITELGCGAVVFDVLSHVSAVKHATPEIEKLLQQFVARSVDANAGRILWGANPYHAAKALFALFDGYPCPRMSDTTNELFEPAAFVGE